MNMLPMSQEPPVQPPCSSAADFLDSSHFPPLSSSTAGYPAFSLKTLLGGGLSLWGAIALLSLGTGSAWAQSLDGLEPVLEQERDAALEAVTEALTEADMEGLPDLPNAIPNQIPNHLPSDLPGELPSEIPTDLSPEIRDAVPADLPPDLLEQVPTPSPSQAVEDAIDAGLDPEIEQAIPGAILLDPLERLESDPLLPDLAPGESLNPQQQRALATALDDLNQEANAAYRRGNVDGAIALWLREARLRRYLGPQAEVATLTQLGEAAWQENRLFELQAVTRRMEQIEQEALAQPTLDYDLLRSIAEGYEAMRARPQAIATYTLLLERAQTDGDRAEMQRILPALGEVQLAWFDYEGAATTYEELRMLAQNRGDRRTEQEALERLALIYQESQEYELALITQTELLSFYDNRQNQTRLAPLKIAMANNYMAIGRPDLAATNYQEAFALARTNEQLGYASDALRNLARLYLTINRLDDARIVYELLVDIERQSYSQYGMMFAYDRIGQIYRVQGSRPQAIAAFQQGLQLARALKYKEDYFQAQIQDLQQPSPSPGTLPTQPAPSPISPSEPEALPPTPELQPSELLDVDPLDPAIPDPTDPDLASPETENQDPEESLDPDQPDESPMEPGLLIPQFEDPATPLQPLF
jgi:tetratricopeptide (TPR) repeat protein